MSQQLPEQICSCASSVALSCRPPVPHQVWSLACQCLNLKCSSITYLCSLLSSLAPFAPSSPKIVWCCSLAQIEHPATSSMLHACTYTPMSSSLPVQLEESNLHNPFTTVATVDIVGCLSCVGIPVIDSSCVCA